MKLRSWGRFEKIWKKYLTKKQKSDIAEAIDIDFLENNAIVDNEIINVEDILIKIIPTIAEGLYAKKTESTKMLLGATPGEQKLFEHKGKFTNLYLHESLGIRTPNFKFEGSRMNADTKIRINNAIGHIESIQMEGETLFVSEKLTNPNLDTQKNTNDEDGEDKIYGEYEDKVKFEHSDDNIVENEKKEITIFLKFYLDYFMYCM